MGARTHSWKMLPCSWATPFPVLLWKKRLRTHGFACVIQKGEAVPKTAKKFIPPYLMFNSINYFWELSNIQAQTASLVSKHRFAPCLPLSKSSSLCVAGGIFLRTNSAVWTKWTIFNLQYVGRWQNLHIKKTRFLCLLIFPYRAFMYFNNRIHWSLTGVKASLKWGQRGIWIIPPLTPF